MEHFFSLYGEHLVWLLFGFLVVALLVLFDSQEERETLKKEAELNGKIIENMHRHINLKIKCDTLHMERAKRDDHSQGIH